MLERRFEAKWLPALRVIAEGRLTANFAMSNIPAITELGKLGYIQFDVIDNHGGKWTVTELGLSTLKEREG